MYKAPDVIKVEVNVEDVFASYGLKTGCPHDMYTSYTIPCTEADPNYTYMDYLQVGWGNGCYSTQNP